MTLNIIIILTSVSFIAGFIDSIAGGGGLIVIPVALISGIPPQLALGTNKFQATLGTSIATINFIHKKKVALKIVLSGILFALVGASIGSHVILGVDPDVVGKLIVFLLPLGVVATLYPRKGVITEPTLSRVDYFIKIPLICLIIGFYDGFFGPGTGSFLTLGFYIFLKLNLTTANANAKVFNFASNISALVTFIIGGKVLYILGIPMAVASMLGNYLGSHLAIKKGDKLIKYFLLVVLILLGISLVVKYFN